ncbi:MAG: hypothetical protein H7345_14440 [Rubritepida sp.]|nr:hypothetical protein [Rubritepida sp.]
MTAGTGFALLLLGACTAGDPFQAHVRGCATGGHAPGGHAFSQCMTQADTVILSDEVRERRRWLQRLQREQVEAEARVWRERVVILARP